MTVYCRAQTKKTLTLSLEIVGESDFSDMAYNSAYLSDVQSMIAKKVHCNIFSTKIF